MSSDSRPRREPVKRWMIDPDPTDMASATSHDGDRAEFLQCVCPTPSASTHRIRLTKATAATKAGTVNTARASSPAHASVAERSGTGAREMTRWSPDRTPTSSRCRSPMRGVRP